MNMNKIQMILGVALASNLISCGEPKTEIEITNDTLRVKNVWMRSDGKRVVEWADKRGIAHILREGSYNDFSGWYTNLIEVVYSCEDKTLVHKKREHKSTRFSRGNYFIDYFRLCLPENFKVPGITTEEGFFLDRKNIEVYNLEDPTQTERTNSSKSEILRTFKTSNSSFSYHPKGDVQKCNVPFRVRDIYLMGFVKRRPREEWDRLRNSGIDEIAELSGLEKLSDTDIAVLCTDEEGRHYVLSAGMLSWMEDRYNIITLKNGGIDTSLVLESCISTDKLKVDHYTLTVPKDVTFYDLKSLQLEQLLEGKQPRELYDALFKSHNFFYDEAIH